MVRIRRRPSLDLVDLHRRMEQAMETLLRGAGAAGGTGSWTPRVDIRETDETILVTIDLPGVHRDAIELTVEGSYLHVTGVRREPEPGGCVRWHQMEIAYGSFERVINLPCAIDPDLIRASFQDGFLHIEIPRAEPPSRQVPIDNA
jgi:HSP20 family protein